MSNGKSRHVSSWYGVMVLRTDGSVGGNTFPCATVGSSTMRHVTMWERSLKHLFLKRQVAQDMFELDRKINYSSE
eukprot:6020875-Amphidinium_carterae.1